MEFLCVILWEINWYLHDLEFIPLILPQKPIRPFYIEEKHLFNCPSLSHPLIERKGFPDIYMTHKNIQVLTVEAKGISTLVLKEIPGTKIMKKASEGQKT